LEDWSLFSPFWFCFCLTQGDEIMMFISGSVFDLPSYECLKALPVRLTHLVFMVNEETEKGNKRWEQFENKLFECHKPCLPYEKREKNKAYFFIYSDAESVFTYEEDYLTKSTDDLWPTGSGWAVRWERHFGFVTFTFYRYFQEVEQSSFLKESESALTCVVKLLGVSGDGLVGEAISGGRLDVAVVPKDYKHEDACKLLHLNKESPSVTGSHVLKGMADVWLSFKEGHRRLRPAVICEIRKTDEETSKCALGELIQILLEIETYRVVASHVILTSQQESNESTDERTQLHKTLNALRSCETNLKGVSEEIYGYVTGEPSFLNKMRPTGGAQKSLNELAGILKDIEQTVAVHTSKYHTAQAYRHLVIRLIHDLHEKPIAYHPTIDSFVRHRLEQANHTCQSIMQRQNTLSEHVSTLDSLLRTRVQTYTEQSRAIALKLSR
jgi:uncharacterized membrane-anchored protein